MIGNFVDLDRPMQSLHTYIAQFATFINTKYDSNIRQRERIH